MSEPKVDLTNCDREPIHIPGSIQPHGTLLSFDQAFQHLTRKAVNAAAFLNLDPARLKAGATLTDLFGDRIAHDLRNSLAESQISRRPSLLFGVDIGSGRQFDLALHRSGTEIIVEFETPSAGPNQPIHIMRTVISQIGTMSTVEAMVERTARLIRAVLDYDRVMVYRFEADGAGQVVSEARSAHLESFLGQFFPASDIPAQARALYLKNRIRVISDAESVPVPLLPDLVGDGPLDLSHAHLRSVSPIHCEYLRNMGVRASMSISIVLDNSLWGMIACHHYAPRPLNMAERAAAEMFGDYLSLNLDVVRQKRRIDLARQARQSLDRLLQEASQHDDVVKLLRSSLGQFETMIPSDGVGLWMNSTWNAEGSVPPASAMSDLVGFVHAQADGGLWSSDRFASVHPPAEAFSEAVSGLFAIPLSKRRGDYLFFFRKEFEHTLNWAGNPEKSYETGPLGDRLTPRKSFAIWKETVKGQSRRWTEADSETAEAIRAALVEVVLRHNELLADERARADLRQRMLNEELNHRVKNILAVIKSLVSQANPEGRSLEEHLATLRGRIGALAIAHDQVVRGDGGGLMHELLMAELRPYRNQAAIDVDGPRLWVDTSAFSVLALVFHELATNSAKYGALSRSEGLLRATWSLAEDGDCLLVWQESRGPTVTPPKRRGFGSVLIARGIPHELGGESQLEFRAEGLQARFRIPARHFALVENDDQKTQSVLAAKATREERRQEMEQVELLLVEDQMLIAMDAEMMLAGFGITRVTTVNSSSGGIKALKKMTPNAAVLDINLGTETSIPVARELARLGVPFVFATGYGDTSIIPEEFSQAPIIRKPYSADDLQAAILRLLEA